MGSSSNPNLWGNNKIDQSNLVQQPPFFFEKKNPGLPDWSLIAAADFPRLKQQGPRSGPLVDVNDGCLDILPTCLAEVRGGFLDKVLKKKLRCCWQCLHEFGIFEATSYSKKILRKKTFQLGKVVFLWGMKQIHCFLWSKCLWSVWNSTNCVNNSWNICWIDFLMWEVSPTFL